MLNDFMVKGQWWLPWQKDIKIPGDVFFSPQRAVQLDLAGLFYNPLIPHVGSYNRPDIINGVTTDGRQWSILGNLNTDTTTYFSSSGKQTYIGNYLLEGQHLATIEELKFSAAQFEFLDLGKWLNRRPFSVEDITMHDRRLVTNFSYSHAPTAKAEIPSRNAQVILSQGLACKMSSSSLDINNKVMFVVIPESAQDLTWYLRFVFDIKNLLALVIGWTPFCQSFQGITFKDAADLDSSKRRYDSLYFAQPNYLPSEVEPISNIFIPYQVLQSRWEDVLNSWLTNIESRRSVSDLFFGYRNKPGQYPRFGLLALMQALESYHRETKSGEYLPKEEYEEVRAKLSSAIPADLRSDLKESLKSRLKFGNEYSLRKRFTELVNDLDPELQALIYPNIKEFINQVVDFRNYLTHYDETSRKFRFDERDLVYLNRRLELFITILLLKDISLDTKTILDAIKSSSWFS